MAIDKKKCSGCREVKSPTDFPVNAARYDGLANYCVVCTREKAARNRREARIALLGWLGGRCVRCGVDDWRALQIDHINGDGAIDRREGYWFGRVARLVRENPERFQVLCANCNSIKRVEEGEHTGIRVYSRAIRTERLVRPRQPSKKAQSYSTARTEASKARQCELLALVEQRRPAQRSPRALTPGRSWSRWYAKCLGCQETSRKHASDGLCWKCDKIAKGLNRRVSVYAVTPPPS